MTDSPTSGSLSTTQRAPFHQRSFWGIAAIALLLRIAVILVYHPQLTDDRDAYLDIARQLSLGNGFRSDQVAPLTAYRPPLYPLLLSLPMRILPEAAAVATVNLFFSMLSVIFVWKLARERSTTFGAAAAALVVSFDPLLLSNVALPMTETAFAGLLVAMVWFAVRPELSRRDRFAVGVLFGLSALCRPTVWAFGAIAGAVWLIVQIRRRAEGFAAVAGKACPAVLAAFITVSPWIVRNALVFGAFIPLTTHGGYTLLLANNSVFYEEVVQRGWRTTWEGKSLARWQQSLKAQMAAETPAVAGEVEEDRWMAARARRTIREQPRLFLQSCLTRLLRFWNPVPISTRERPVSRFVGFGIGVFCVVLFAGVVVSGWRTLFALRTHRVDWLTICAWCLIISMTLVHLIYWSNLRRRAPL